LAVVATAADERSADECARAERGKARRLVHPTDRSAEL
jgi:hypothetical protein